MGHSRSRVKRRRPEQWCKSAIPASIFEVPSGVHTIAGVATSVTAFFGRASRGPINKAVHVLSPSDYERYFGAPHPSSDLAQSVRQFFDNGGAECYVVRLAHNAVKANLTLRNLADAQNVLNISAKAEGDAGNWIRVRVDYDTANPDDTFNLIVTYEEGGVVVTESRSRILRWIRCRRDSPRRS